MAVSTSDPHDGPSPPTDAAAPTGSSTVAYIQVELPKRTRSTYTSIIKVIVGPEGEQETFYVHEDIIREHSKFCETALSKNWAENQEKIIKLPEQEPEVFRMYLECLYTPGVVDFAALSGLQLVEGQIVDKSNSALTLASLFKLWIAADFLGDLKQANDVMDGIIMSQKSHGLGIRWGSMITAYNNTAPSAGLRRWVIDWWSAIMDPSQLTSPGTIRIPHGLLVLLLKKVREDAISGKMRTAPTFANRSEYHM